MLDRTKGCMIIHKDENMILPLGYGMIVKEKESGHSWHEMYTYAKDTHTYA